MCKSEQWGVFQLGSQMHWVEFGECTLVWEVWGCIKTVSCIQLYCVFCYQLKLVVSIIILASY